MDKNINNNNKTNYSYNTKFPNFFRSQPVDNIFVQSLSSNLKFQKCIYLNIPPTKKKKLNYTNIVIDDNLQLNYEIENNYIINKYISYLIQRGIIIQHENILHKYVLTNHNKTEYVYDYNSIEKVNNIQILKKKRILIPQIIAQIYIGNEDANKNKKVVIQSEQSQQINILEKNYLLGMPPQEKEPLQKQINDKIVVMNKVIKPENYEERVNNIEIICRKKIITLIDQGISLKIIGDKSNLNHTSIIQENKSINNNIQKSEKREEINLLQEKKIIKYYIQKPENINIIENRKLTTFIQKMDNFNIYSKSKKPYVKCINDPLFIKGKIRKNYIQATEKLSILRKKKQFFIIDKVFILSIYSDNNNKSLNEEEEYEEEDEDGNNINTQINIENNIEGNIYINNNISDENNINNENNISMNNPKRKLRSRKIMRTKSKRIKNESKNNAPYEIISENNLFIECTYDMLVVVKTWDDLKVEKVINHLYIGDFNNINRNPNIYRNNNHIIDIYNEDNSPGKINNNWDTNNEIKINDSFEIKEEPEKIIYPPPQNDKVNNWNNVIFPKFNNYIKILGNKKNNKKKLNSKLPKNIKVKEIWFYIPGIIFPMKLTKSNNNNNRYWNNNCIKYDKGKYFTILKNNRKIKYNSNKISSEIIMNIYGNKQIPNLNNSRNDNPNFLKNLKRNINSNKESFDKNSNNNNIINHNLKYKNKHINNNSLSGKNNLFLDERNNNINENNNQNISIDTSINIQPKQNNNIIYKNNNNNNDINLFSKNNININNINNSPRNNNNININKSNIIKNNKIDIKKNDIKINNNDYENNSHNPLNLHVCHYSIKDDPFNINIRSYNNNTDNESNNISIYNNRREIININSHNDDIVNLGNSSSNLFFNKNNISGTNKNRVIISNKNYLIQNGEEGPEQVIDRDDYNYQSNKNEILKSMKNKNLIIKQENKRYAEDIDTNRYGTSNIKRSRTVNKYNNFFKIKSSDSLPIGNIRKNLVKNNSDKQFELLRDYSFDNDNYY